MEPVRQYIKHTINITHIHKFLHNMVNNLVQTDLHSHWSGGPHSRRKTAVQASGHTVGLAILHGWVVLPTEIDYGSNSAQASVLCSYWVLSERRISFQISLTLVMQLINIQRTSPGKSSKFTETKLSCYSPAISLSSRTVWRPGDYWTGLNCCVVRPGRRREDTANQNERGPLTSSDSLALLLCPLEWVQAAFQSNKIPRIQEPKPTTRSHSGSMAHTWFLVTP